MQRVEYARLAFGDLRIAETHEIVPERQYTRPQRIGEIRLLREEIGIDVAADEAAPDPQRLPEDNREQHGRQHESPAYERPTAQRFALPPLISTERAVTARRRNRRRRVNR